VRFVSLPALRAGLQHRNLETYRETWRLTGKPGDLQGNLETDRETWRLTGKPGDLQENLETYRET
jgi:hypothetical protein